MGQDSKPVRVITFNTAVGNPKIKTPQREFLKLPFYREVIEGAPDAPILALQEVGPEQAKALKEAAAEGAFQVVHIQRPGQGNAILIPSRFEVIKRRAWYYGGSQLPPLAVALWRAARERQKLNYRQYLELRMWIRVTLANGQGRGQFTV